MAFNFNIVARVWTELLQLTLSHSRRSSIFFVHVLYPIFHQNILAENHYWETAIPFFNSCKLTSNSILKSRSTIKLKFKFTKKHFLIYIDSKNQYDPLVSLPQHTRHSLRLCMHFHYAGGVLFLYMYLEFSFHLQKAHWNWLFELKSRVTLF